MSSFIRSAHADVSIVGDRAVLYHRVSRAAIVLNPTGSWLWERLVEPRTRADLARDLQARFPSISHERADTDVQSFLADLASHAMIAPVP